MPPSVADWLEPGHLAWFMLEVVEEMDLAAFYAAYRRDGRGGAAFDPAMMVALLLYSYATGERSSRKIEERCGIDVAYRVLCANQQPDHTTISRFRQQHERHLEELFVESVRLCAEAGLAQVATCAVDGRRVAGDASPRRSYTRERVRKWFEEADAIDAVEDELYGEGNRGPEVPEGLRDRKGMREAIKRAKAALDAQDAKVQATHDERLRERQEMVARTGKTPPGRQLTAEPPKRSLRGSAKVNLTDPDSRIFKARGGFVQGYNTLAMVSADQIIVGASVVSDTDTQQLTPMIDETRLTLRTAGVYEPIRHVLADAGFGTDAELNRFETDSAFPELLVATGHRTKRDGSVDPDTPRGRMDAHLKTRRGKQLFGLRCQTVEPVFGQQHTVQRFDRFSRRGIAAVKSEFKLVSAAHNLLKLWRHTNRTAIPAPA